MNWNKIKETKAGKEFENFIHIKLYGNFSNAETANALRHSSFESLIGWLFKFFDERGIIVEVTNIDKYITKSVFTYAIIMSTKKVSHIYNTPSEKEFPDRQSALQEGFEKAFEILEGQL